MRKRKKERAREREKEKKEKQEYRQLLRMLSTTAVMWPDTDMQLDEVSYFYSHFRYRKQERRRRFKRTGKGEQVRLTRAHFFYLWREDCMCTGVNNISQQVDGMFINLPIGILRCELVTLASSRIEERNRREKDWAVVERKKEREKVPAHLSEWRSAHISCTRKLHRIVCRCTVSCCSHLFVLQRDLRSPELLHSASSSCVTSPSTFAACSVHPFLVANLWAKRSKCKKNNYVCSGLLCSWRRSSIWISDGFTITWQDSGK